MTPQPIPEASCSLSPISLWGLRHHTPQRPLHPHTLIPSPSHPRPHPPYNPHPPPPHLLSTPRQPHPFTPTVSPPHSSPPTPSPSPPHPHPHTLTFNLLQSPGQWRRAYMPVRRLGGGVCGGGGVGGGGGGWRRLAVVAAAVAVAVAAQTVGRAVPESRVHMRWQRRADRTHQ